MNIICKICREEVTKRSHFFRNHRIKEKDYYEKYLPKKDLITGEKIEFKNPEQYELQDFNDKKNLKKFLEKNNEESNVDYLVNWIERRSNLKNISMFPGEFEIKSLNFPSLKYLIQKYGEEFYNKIALKSGLKIRFDYENLFLKDEINGVIYCDTREQLPLNLGGTKLKKLNYGDYNLEGSSIYIERKSLNDFIGTMSKGFDRFKNELDRCVIDNNYLVVLIEEQYKNLLSFNYLPHCKKIGATPDFIMHRARELLNEYPYNLQMLAVDGRLESSRMIERLFKIDKEISKVDLQYFYSKGEL